MKTYDDYGFKRMNIDHVSLEACQQEAGMAERARTQPSYLSPKHREGNGSSSELHSLKAFLQ